MLKGYVMLLCYIFVYVANGAAMMQEKVQNCYDNKVLWYRIILTQFK